MLVKKNDKIVRIRDKQAFKVMAANSEMFTVCKLNYNLDDFEWSEDYGYVMSYSNKGLGLDYLGFVKI